MVVGGARNLSLGSSYFQPSVLVGASTDMQLAREETFGPMASIIKCVAPAVLYLPLRSLVPILHWKPCKHLRSLVPMLCSRYKANGCVA